MGPAGHVNATLAGLAAVVLVVLSAVGDELDVSRVHHDAHVALPVMAFGIFSGLVAREIRRHGWPTFSWRP
jgi:hypothetical protein